MKKLILVLLLTLSAYAEVDHVNSWPKLETGVAVPDSFAIVTSGSNDEAGTIVLWTGAGCCRETGRGGLMRVILARYGQPYETTQFPNLTAANGEAGALSGDNGVFVDQEHSNRLYFEIAVNWKGLERGKTYSWNYAVKGRP